MRASVFWDDLSCQTPILTSGIKPDHDDWANGWHASDAEVDIASSANKSKRLSDSLCLLPVLGTGTVCKG